MVTWLGAVFSAGPLFWLVVTLVRAWSDPMAVDGGLWVRMGVGLMLMEFIVLHSGGFMGALAVGDVAPRRKLALFLGLAAFYGLFAWAFAAALGTWTVLKIYGLLMAGRYLTVMAADKVGKTLLLVRSAVGVGAYLGTVFLTLFVPVPRAVITYDVLDQVYPGRGSGVWEQQPQIAIAAAVLYFAIMGVFEVVVGLRGAMKVVGGDAGVLAAGRSARGVLGGEDGGRGQQGGGGEGSDGLVEGATGE